MTGRYGTVRDTSGAAGMLYLDYNGSTSTHTISTSTSTAHLTAVRTLLCCSRTIYIRIGTVTYTKNYDA